MLTPEDRTRYIKGLDAFENLDAIDDAEEWLEAVPDLLATILELDDEIRDLRGLGR